MISALGYLHRAYDEALKERLLLVGRRDNPGQRKDDVGQISVDRIREYVLNNDVHTGKRKADMDVRPTKRHVEPRRESSEELSVLLVELTSINLASKVSEVTCFRPCPCQAPL